MNMEQGLAALLLPVIAYLMGSIPFGLLIARGLGRGDIRESGSGNIGATNVRRTVGTLPAVATLTGDIAKGFLPVWWAGMLAPPWAVLLGAGLHRLGRAVRVGRPPLSGFFEISYGRQGCRDGGRWSAGHRARGFGGERAGLCHGRLRFEPGVGRLPGGHRHDAPYGLVRDRVVRVYPLGRGDGDLDLEPPSRQHPTAPGGHGTADMEKPFGRMMPTPGFYPPYGDTIFVID